MTSLLYYKFTAEPQSKKNWKIRQYLAK